MQAAQPGPAVSKSENVSRSSTPPASTWVGQRRTLDQDMEAAIDSFAKETSETNGRRSIGQRVSPAFNSTAFLGSLMGRAMSDTLCQLVL